MDSMVRPNGLQPPDRPRARSSSLNILTCRAWYVDELRGGWRQTAAALATRAGRITRVPESIPELLCPWRSDALTIAGRTNYQAGRAAAGWLPRLDAKGKLYFLSLR
jgi:hypothetical protein